MLPIQPIVAPAVDQIAPVSLGAASGAGKDFSALLSQAVANVENGQQQTGAAMDRFLSGEDVEVHQVALLAQKAEMQFDLFMQVRNKVIAAYQEVMKMQL